ncbi:MAG: hypothetical protein SGILL_002580, partial [Bacillariaceae sp.]
WLEVGGATSIAIPFDASTELVQDILSQVDGILFPGGGAPVPPSAKDIWRLLHEDYYPRGDMVPVWGTCLGMEFIVQLAADNFDDTILEDGYNATNISLPLLEVERVGLYESQYIYEAVVHHNIAMNNHHLGISPERFRETDSLASSWQITSTNIDLNGKSFVSTIEPIDKQKNPIYGVQFHPEKNAFEYGFRPNTTIPYEAIDHSPEGIAFSVHLAGYFVNTAKENMNKARFRREHESRRQKHYNAKSAIYPRVYEYPREVGNKFEERFIVPPARTLQQEAIIEQIVSSSQSRLRKK